MENNGLKRLEFLEKHADTMDGRSITIIKDLSIKWLNDYTRILETLTNPIAIEEFKQMFEEDVAYHELIITKCDILFETK